MYLAPKGTLLTPEVVFKNKKLGPAAEEAIRKAFKITIKKLRKLRSACAACGKKEGNYGGVNSMVISVVLKRKEIIVMLVVVK